MSGLVLDISVVRSHSGLEILINSHNIFFHGMKLQIGHIEASPLGMKYPPEGCEIIIVMRENYDNYPL